MQAVHVLQRRAVQHGTSHSGNAELAEHLRQERELIERNMLREQQGKSRTPKHAPTIAARPNTSTPGLAPETITTITGERIHEHV